MEDENNENDAWNEVVTCQAYVDEYRDEVGLSGLDLTTAEHNVLKTLLQEHGDKSGDYYFWHKLFCDILNEGLVPRS